MSGRQGDILSATKPSEQMGWCVRYCCAGLLILWSFSVERTMVTILLTLADNDRHTYRIPRGLFNRTVINLPPHVAF